MFSTRILKLLSIITLSTSVVVAQTPPSAISHFKVGIKENKKNNFDRAIEEFTIAIEISSHPGPHRAGKRFSPQHLAGGAELDSIEETKTITILDKFTAVAYANRCFARCRKGDFAGAIADCDQAIRITPRLVEAYLNRGIARAMVGDDTAALIDLNGALEIDPHLVEALVGRGSLRKDLGDIDGALSDLNRALALDQRSAAAYLFRGYALQSLWRGAGFWSAALITTALFAGDHLEKPHENAIDIGMIFALAIVLCISVRVTGSLWWAVGWHAAFDFGQFFVIGTPNGGRVPQGRLFDVTSPGPAWITGGELGTEASYFMIPAVIGTFLYVILFLRRRSSPV